MRELESGLLTDLSHELRAPGNVTPNSTALSRKQKLLLMQRWLDMTEQKLRSKSIESMIQKTPSQDPQTGSKPQDVGKDDPSDEIRKLPPAIAAFSQMLRGPGMPLYMVAFEGFCQLAAKYDEDLAKGMRQVFEDSQTHALTTTAAVVARWKRAELLCAATGKQIAKMEASKRHWSVAKKFSRGISALRNLAASNAERERARNEEREDEIAALSVEEKRKIVRITGEKVIEMEAAALIERNIRNKPATVIKMLTHDTQLRLVRGNEHFTNGDSRQARYTNAPLEKMWKREALPDMIRTRPSILLDIIPASMKQDCLELLLKDGDFPKSLARSWYNMDQSEGRVNPEVVAYSVKQAISEAIGPELWVAEFRSELVKQLLEEQPSEVLIRALKSMSAEQNFGAEVDVAINNLAMSIELSQRRAQKNSELELDSTSGSLPAMI